MFIFVIFKMQFYRKFLDLSGIRTRIVRVEGEDADHHHDPFLLNVLEYIHGVHGFGNYKQILGH